MDTEVGMSTSVRHIAQLEKGNIDRAIECFTGSVGIDPGYAPAYLNRGSGR